MKFSGIGLVFALAFHGCAPVFSAPENTGDVAPDVAEQWESACRDRLTLFTYDVVQAFPHDRQAFTQGLMFHEDYLYESTGLRGRSSLRQVELETGVVVRQHNLDARYFGEGLTILNSRIYQLTWTSNTGFVYDLETFALLETFQYPTEGWGLTHDGEHLIMSDGTSSLYFLDPEDFTLQRTVQVRDPNGPVTNINEMAYIDGEVYAMVWLTDKVVRICPEDGRVTGWIDLSGLLTPEERAAADVLNGITHDPDCNRFFVTGKLWPKLFEVVFLPE